MNVEIPPVESIWATDGLLDDHRLPPLGRALPRASRAIAFSLTAPPGDVIRIGFTLGGLIEIAVATCFTMTLTDRGIVGSWFTTPTYAESVPVFNSAETIPVSGSTEM